MKTHPVVLITGASSGIGAAAAKKYSSAGYRVIGVARRLERLKELPLAHAFALDVRDREGVFQTVAQIEKEIGPIQILINNAGCGIGTEPAYKTNIEEWEMCVDVNIKGLLYFTRAVLPSMVERQTGDILNLGSITAHYPSIGNNVYGATKAFIHQFTLNLRTDLVGMPIRVSVIEPGLVETEFFDVRYRGDQEKVKATFSTKPLQPEDIADILFYTTSLPPHVNVTTLEVLPTTRSFPPGNVKKP